MSTHVLSIHRFNHSFMAFNIILGLLTLVKEIDTSWSHEPPAERLSAKLHC